MNSAFGEGSFSLENVTNKIKVTASRKAYVKNPAVASGLPVPNTTSKDIDTQEDENPDHMWRWEIVAVDALPEQCKKDVKATRTKRKNLLMHFNATAKLLAALNESIKLLGDSTSKATKAKVDKAVAKISSAEENVLKFERKEEVARQSAKKKKDSAAVKTKKQQEKAEKEAEKERQKEEKRQQAEERKKRKEVEKQRKELEKQKKANEKEEKKRLKEEQEQQEKAAKARVQEEQKKMFASFFGGPPKKKAKIATSPMKEAPPQAPIHDDVPKPVSVVNDFDSDKFQSSINSLQQVEKTGVFSSLSKRAIDSRKKRIKPVKMRVFLSGINADNPFAAPAFAEEKIMEFRNRNKFLCFTEDHRYV